MTPDSLDPRYAHQAIKVGSKSFAAAARLFEPQTRESAVKLYAWCRHCDDLVDGQELGHGQQAPSPAVGLERLAHLEAATWKAWSGQPVGDPVFDGLAEVVQRHDIPWCYLMEHLKGFRMDIDGASYATPQDLLPYCWRVAGTVGVMMSLVMGRRDPVTLDRACDLGIAFQLTNIARDVVEDAAAGRVYLPLAWLAEENLPTGVALAEPAHREGIARVTTRLLQLAEHYYDSALHGLSALPLRSAWSIATARGVYRAIGHKVRRFGPRAWDTRVATSSAEKVWHVLEGGALALATRTQRSEPRRLDLFARPA